MDLNGTQMDFNRTLMAFNGIKWDVLLILVEFNGVLICFDTGFIGYNGN